MTEWATVNLPKKLKEKIQKDKVENGTYASAKEFIVQATREKLEQQNGLSEERVKEIIREELD